MSNWLYYGCSNGLGVLFVIVFLAVSLKLYSGKSYKERLKPLWFLTFLLIALEVIKIFYHITEKGAYPVQRYPYVFCSLVMYFYPIICLTSEKSIFSRVSKALAIVPSLVLGVGYLVAFGDASNADIYSFVMNLHSRLYHFAMFGCALYMIINKLYDFEFKDFYFSGITAGAYFTLCTVISLFIGGDLSYFGPTTKITQPIYNLFGYAVGNILLGVVAVIASLLVFSLVKLIKNLINKRKNQA